jgi:hypothetical protein
MYFSNFKELHGNPDGSVPATFQVILSFNFVKALLSKISKFLFIMK